jgi:hypothetical protein
MRKSRLIVMLTKAALPDIQQHGCKLPVGQRKRALDGRPFSSEKPALEWPSERPIPCGNARDTVLPTIRWFCQHGSAP